MNTFILKKERKKETKRLFIKKKNNSSFFFFEKKTVSSFFFKFLKFRETPQFLNYPITNTMNEFSLKKKKKIDFALKGFLSLLLLSFFLSFILSKRKMVLD